MMQSHGAELLRYATIKLVAARLAVIALIHDALVIECAVEDAERVAAQVQKIMGDVSETILGPGFRLRSKVKILHDHERFADVRGQKMFDLVMTHLRRAEAEERRIRREARQPAAPAETPTPGSRRPHRGL
jgi:hypothetical protein